MSKPRKKYRPRLARTDVFALAIQGTALLAKSDQATMAEPVKLAVDRIAQGVATRDDWQDVFDVLNRLERFATMPTVTHREYFTAEERAQKKLQTVLRAKNPAPGVRFVEAA